MAEDPVARALLERAIEDNLIRWRTSSGIMRVDYTPPLSPVGNPSTASIVYVIHNIEKQSGSVPNFTTLTTTSPVNTYRNSNSVSNAFNTISVQNRNVMAGYMIHTEFKLSTSSTIRYGAAAFVHNLVTAENRLSVAVTTIFGRSVNISYNGAAALFRDHMLNRINNNQITPPEDIFGFIGNAITGLGSWAFEAISDVFNNAFNIVLEEPSNPEEVVSDVIEIVPINPDGSLGEVAKTHEHTGEYGESEEISLEGVDDITFMIRRFITWTGGFNRKVDGAIYDATQNIWRQNFKPLIEGPTDNYIPNKPFQVHDAISRSAWPIGVGRC